MKKTDKLSLMAKDTLPETTAGTVRARVVSHCWTRRPALYCA
jgi:hypothetical protein